MSVVIIAILILINGFFALSEIALVTSKRIKLESLKAQGRKGASKALSLQDNSEEFLSAIQVGITLVGIIMGMYSGIHLASQVQPLLESIGIAGSLARELSLVVTVFIVTYASIVIGELVPKTIALRNPEQIATIIAPAVFYFGKIFYPFVKLLSVSTNMVRSLLNIKEQNDKITESELRQMMKMASAQGVIEQGQNALHEKVFFFSDKQAKHLMTHRSEIEWLDLNKSGEEIWQSIVHSRHSKLICCESSIDDFTGVLYLRDYFKEYASGRQPDIRSLMQQPFVIKYDTSAQNILELIKKDKIYLFIVINQQRDLEGIITLHDVLEHIVGNVPNEGEDFEPEILTTNEDAVLVNGEAPVEILTELIDGFTINFETVDYSSVAGYVFFQLNKEPEVGDQIELYGYIIEVESLDRGKIDNVLISKKSVV